MRVALFGGTFDPPHRGHFAIARAATDAFNLNRVIFAPTGRQPLKPLGALASYADRLQMVDLMCAHDARFQSSAVDAPSPDGRPNYTVNTLEQLRRDTPDGTQWFAIVGADSFLDLPHWYDFERLMTLAEWIVVSRPGFTIHRSSIEAQERGVQPRIHVLEGVIENVSSTDLRQKLARSEDCSGLLLPEVAAFIEEHRLYR